MANSYKILGQVAPSATTTTTLYTVPSDTEAIVNSFMIINRDSSASTFRISIRPTGESLSDKHYQIYDSGVPGNDTLFLSPSWALSAGDIVEVYSLSGLFSFTATGVEIS